MPGVDIVGAIKFVGGLLVGTTGTAVTQFIARTAFAVTLSAVSNKLFAPKIPGAQSTLTGLQVTRKSALEYRKIVYGEALVSGPIVFQGTSGDEGEYLWSVIALCDGESEEITEVWFDGTQLTDLVIDWTPSATGSGGSGTGEVSLGTMLGANGTNAARIFWTLGDANQVDLDVLTTEFSDLNSNFRGRGVTIGVVSLLYNEDTEEVWRDRGQPRDVKFLVKGRKCYDRRKDALNDDPDFATLVGPDAVDSGLRWFADDNEDQQALTNASGGFSVSAGVVTIIDNDDSGENLTSEKIPCDTSKTYIARVTARQVSGDRKHYLGVAFYDSNRNLISPSTETGWDGTGTYFYFDIVNAIFNASATGHVISFGPSGDADIPSNAAFMSLKFLLCRTGAVGTETTIEISDARIFEGTTTANQHQFETPSGWSWSDNPSVCLADYLTQIVGVAYEDIDWEAMITCAQYCDETVAIPTASTETRFTCNGALSLGDKHKDNIEKILSSMGGRLYWQGGKWRWDAARWEAPTITIDADWLVDQSIDMQGFEEPSQRVNTIRGYFVDPARNYEAVEFQQVTNAAYVTRDGGVTVERELVLSMTNTETMCERIAMIALDQGDYQKVLRIPMNERAIMLRVGDRVSVDLKSLGIGTVGNQVVRDSTFSSSYWVKSNVTVTTDDAIGPHGGQVADKIEATATGLVSMYTTDTLAGTGAYFTIYVKRGSGDTDLNRFVLRNQSQAIDLVDVNVNLLDGTVINYNDGGAENVQIEHVGNGWLRIGLHHLDVANGDVVLLRIGGAGITSYTAGDFIHVCGAQLVAISDMEDIYPDMPPYVPNDTAAVIPASNFVGRVIEWGGDPMGDYVVTIQEDASAIYDDPVEGDYSGATVSSITAQTLVVPSPRNLSASPVPYGIKLLWKNPAAGTFDYIDIYASSSSAWSGASKIASVRTDTYTHELPSSETRYYWIRARKNSGDQSNRLPNSDTTTITATTAGDAQTVQLQGDSNIRDIQVDPTNAVIGYRLNNSGIEEYNEAGAYTTIGTWLLDGAAADYDCRLTIGGSNPTSGDSTGAWLSCGTTRTWTWTRSVVGWYIPSATIEIRDGTTLEVLASAPVSGRAEQLSNA